MGNAKAGVLSKSKKLSDLYNPITEGKIGREMLKFFFPILFGTLFQTLYNTADAVIVGRFVGKEAFSAVGGSTHSLISMIVGFFIGTSSGATILVAQRYGAQNDKETEDAVHTSVAFALLIGVLLTILGTLISGRALVWLGTPEDILPYAVAYLRIYFYGILFNILYNIGSSVLRALGDSRTPLFILIFCCVLNILLDLLFVGLLDLKTEGVAYATVLSQMISSSLILWRLAKKQGAAKLYFSKIRIHGYLLKQLLRIGIPAGLQTSMFGIANMLIVSTVNSFGTDVVAGWSAYGKIDNFIWMVLNSFGIAASTFVGQNLGARKLDRVFRSARVGLLQSFAGCGALLVIVLVFRTTIVQAFTSDEEVIRIAADMMMHGFPIYWIYAYIEVYGGSIRGAGDALPPMLITCIGICVTRVLLITFVIPHFHTYNALILLYPISWTITAISYNIYFHSNRWLKHYPDLLNEARARKQRRKEKVQ